MKPFIFILLVSIGISCTPDFVSELCPTSTENSDSKNWLQEKINGYKNTISGVKIWKLTYHNDVVFMINDCVNCYDGMVVVYNCEGAIICEFGGLAGLNTCPDFEANSSKPTLIWSRK